MQMTRDIHHDARKIFGAGLKAADPKEAIKRSIVMKGRGMVQVAGRSLVIADYNDIYVVGAGKAAAPMAQAVEEIFGKRIKSGSVTTKYGHGLPLNRVSLLEASHPMPDEAGLVGSQAILDILQGAGDNDLVICLISGGGSALMPLPVDGITLEDKQKTTGVLLACGATIHEINAIRKHISAIKGGKLARAAAPATVVSLLLSDVIGDNLDVIASGPTVPDHSTYADCLAIIKKYAIEDRIPHAILSYLREGAEGKHDETPKEDDPAFNRSMTAVIGSGSISLRAAKEFAEKAGYNSLVLSSSIEGETKDVALVHAAIAKEVLKSGNPVPPPACIISGGETTVTIRGTGLGGRNMEFVLAAAREIDGYDGIVILSGGTDGTDGPTDAAGAVADGSTLKRARGKGMVSADYLANNDSYHFFEALDDLLKTGPTMTNVMDLRVMLVE